MWVLNARRELWDQRYLLQLLKEKSHTVCKTGVDQGREGLTERLAEKDTCLAKERRRDDVASLCTEWGDHRWWNVLYFRLCVHQRAPEAQKEALRRSHAWNESDTQGHWGQTPHPQTKLDLYVCLWMCVTRPRSEPLQLKHIIKAIKQTDGHVVIFYFSSHWAGPDEGQLHLHTPPARAKFKTWVCLS